MLSILRKSKKTELSKNALVAAFYSTPEHSWIVEDKYIKSHFDEFFDYVPSSLLNKIVIDHNIKFVPITGKYSCAISAKNLILVFPELLELLTSTVSSYCNAILAHEIGHIIYSHGSKSQSVIETQVEADTLAIELGFGKDLEKFLLDQPESIEKRIRLSYLTSKYYNESM